MEYIVVAFRSRTQTVKFSEMLKARGIPNDIINTPKQAGVGCGLSVKIEKEYFSLIKKILANNPQSSFAGFFLVRTYSGKTIVRSI